MLKILWKRGKIAPEEQFLPLSTIFYYLMIDFYVKTGIRFSLRDKRLFEITEVEITRVTVLFIYKKVTFITMIILKRFDAICHYNKGSLTTAISNGYIFAEEAVCVYVVIIYYYY